MNFICFKSKNLITWYNKDNFKPICKNCACWNKVWKPKEHITLHVSELNVALELHSKTCFLCGISLFSLKPASQCQKCNEYIRLSKPNSLPQIINKNSFEQYYDEFFKQQFINKRYK